MNNQIVITWNQAQNLEQQLQQETQNQQDRYLTEFLESNPELFDWKDFSYYSELTGKSISELKEMHPEFRMDLGRAVEIYGTETDDIFDIY